MIRHATTTKEKPFGCTYPGCYKSFARKDCQQLHIKTHTGEKTYMCDVLVKSCGCEENCTHIADTQCGKFFITSSHLNRHKKTHRDPFIHICDIETCDARYKKKSQLRQHKLDAHGLAEFLCEEEGCGRHFVSKAKLIIHQKSRHGGFMCPVITCSAMFPSNDLLLQHLTTHDSNVTLVQKRRSRKKMKQQQSFEEEPYHPEEVERNFMDDNNFNLDDEIEMMYAGGSYEDEDDEGDENDVAYSDVEDNDDDVYFIKHIREGGGKRKRARSLSMSSDKPDKTVSSATVPDKKPFVCPHPDCSRSFSQNKNLEAHVRALHSVERPYPCPEPFCGMAFGFKSVLERHLLKCHGRMAVIAQPSEPVDTPANTAIIEPPTSSNTQAGASKDNDTVQDGQYQWNSILGINYANSTTV